MDEEYRDFVIQYTPPPVPHRGADWQFVHRDYDGPEDGRCGFASSLAEVRRQIDELHAESGPGG